jgi:phosphoglycolate phosphatase-like HAD superfamily hydrolase
MNKLALFDCDGTLVDSQHNIILCMDDAFHQAGLTPPSRDETKRIVGLSLLPAMQVLAPDGAHDLHLQLAKGSLKSRFLKVLLKRSRNWRRKAGNSGLLRESRIAGSLCALLSTASQTFL